MFESSGIKSRDKHSVNFFSGKIEKVEFEQCEWSFPLKEKSFKRKVFSKIAKKKDLPDYSTLM